jgi:hypothetical protein
VEGVEERKAEAVEPLQAAVEASRAAVEASRAAVEARRAAVGFNLVVIISNLQEEELDKERDQETPEVGLRQRESDLGEGAVIILLASSVDVNSI